MMKILTLLYFLCTSAVAAPITFVTESLPPYQIVDKNQKLIGGTSFAIMQRLTKRSQLNVQFEVMPWSRAYKTALTKKNTFIFSIARSPQRENLFHWVGHIRQLKFHFYGLSRTNKDGASITHLISNQRVASVRGSIEVDLLKQIGFKENENLILTDSYQAAWKLVLKGRADSVYGNEYIAKGMTKSLGLDKATFSVNFTLNQVLNLYLAANIETDEDLIKRVKIEFNQMIMEGELDHIITQQENIIFNN
ncbi:substrate-binding periplasmic protein [Pseudoalteromonas denitrificans]|uniref:Extracellular solute-binding protein, family 3 n=1 Tax=Pseudoalteromonas denitrificans DSM 6059 TaxID=1123010 RepID=A0A1I1U413_9GAMM|nr:transporter substrate-binding domain-containing protein [Pseudoalteromonas denitrificans]SFD65537.1 extracellular solute-binding protein, family 3 [Pseudoalteromonas denitrificans DSM 6059]